jgi:phosphate-selective porin OprO/OprP
MSMPSAPLTRRHAVLSPPTLAGGLAALCLTLASSAGEAAPARRSDPESTIRALLERLDAQEQRIQALEHRLAEKDAVSAPAVAQATPDAAEEQDARLRVVERKLELQQEAAAALAAEAPVIRAGTKGFSIASKDGANVLRLRGVLNVDGRWFLNDDVATGSDTWLLRLARPYIEGTLGRIVDFRLMPDFAGGKTVIQDAFVAARFDPRFVLTAGKFKVPFGLERLQSDTDTRFVERGLTNNLVPNRDLGLQVSGDVGGGALAYQVAWQNGVVDSGSSDGQGDVDNDGSRDVAVRLFAQPLAGHPESWFQGLGVGIAATRGTTDGSPTRTTLPTYRSPGQQSIFAYRGGTNPTFALGERTRVSPQAYFYRGPFGLLAEYVQVRQDVARTVGTVQRADRLTHDAWQVEATWFVTGEESGFRAASPRRAFGSGGYGAVELVARVGELKLDPDAFVGGAGSFADPASAVRRARAFGIGANWYLTPNLTAVLDYEQTAFDGGAAGGVDRKDERIVFGRFQTAF